MQFEPLRIYHEHQSSQLCARHCLNNLLQGPYFTEFDLSQIALELDKEEQALLSQDGNDGLLEWLKHNKQSQNVSDDGNFSIQVLRRALDNLALRIYHFGNQELGPEAQQHPEREQGFICNLQAHWFAIRRIEGQWFNLNSLSGLPETTAKPTTISNFYLSAFLSSLSNDGYSIFVVRSDNWPHLHSYDAEQLLPPYAKWQLVSDIKSRQDTYPKDLLSEVGRSRNGQQVTSMGWGNNNNNINQDMPSDMMAMNEDPELAHALALSMQQGGATSSSVAVVRDVREVDDGGGDDDEDMMLQQALAMSLVEDSSVQGKEEAEECKVVSEPDEEEDECCSIQLRLKQNKRVNRRFRMQHTLGDVAVFAKTQDGSYGEIVFVCPPMNSYADMSVTLEKVCGQLNSKKLAFNVKEVKKDKS